jgi:triacylglycerol lipase
LWFKLLGDENPDFNVAIKGFTTYHTEEFNKNNPDINGVYYQSYAAVMKNSFSDILMFFPHFTISLIEGENDGLVTPESAKWGNFKGILKGNTNRGISHADEVDARRMKLSARKDTGDINDICDVYVKIVSDLKSMGY